jgi:hypothetical protein
LALVGVVEEAGELSGADHPGLVYDEYRSGRQHVIAAMCEAGFEGGDGGGVDAGGLLQFECGPGSERDPRDGDAGLLPPAGPTCSASSPSARPTAKRCGRSSASSPM